MRRIVSIKGALIFAVIAIAIALVMVSLVLAGAIITRGQPASVSVVGQLSVAEVLVL